MPKLGDYTTRLVLTIRTIRAIISTAPIPIIVHSRKPGIAVGVGTGTSITVTSAGGVGSTIDIRNTDKYLTILNCTLNNTGSTGAGIYLSNASQVTIRNSTIKNNQNYGIYVSSTSMNVTIDNNTLYQSGTWGILTYSPNITIINNEISQCDDYGILVQGILRTTDIPEEGCLSEERHPLCPDR